MNAIELLRSHYNASHEFLEGTLADVTPDQVNVQPGGRTNSIGSNYAHVVCSEDGFIQGMIRGAAPLMAGKFAGKIGASSPPPQGFEWGDWAKSVTIDLPAMREYAQAVYANTDEYLATLKDADLDRELDMGPMGKWTVG